MKRLLLLAFALLTLLNARAAFLLIPMDESQTNHLKAYGIAYYVLQRDLDVQWLLNYRGGSFLIRQVPAIEQECSIRGVSFQVIADAQAASILAAISDPEVNQDVVKLEKAPKIAVYSPKNKMPWDDAVTLALTYAEIPYEVVYDEEVLQGKLPLYDWLHLHHEDFTGQYGRFWSAYRKCTLVPGRRADSGIHGSQTRLSEGVANETGRRPQDPGFRGRRWLSVRDVFGYGFV